MYYWTDATAAFAVDSIRLETTGWIAEVVAADVDADGVNELVVTYLASNTYTTVIYDLICGTTCQPQLQKIDFTPLAAMTAVPFIIDLLGDGSLSLFTFNGTDRTLFSYSLDRSKLYPSPHAACPAPGPPISPLAPLPSPPWATTSPLRST